MGKQSLMLPIFLLNPGFRYISQMNQKGGLWVSRGHISQNPGGVAVACAIAQMGIGGDQEGKRRDFGGLAPLGRENGQHSRSYKQKGKKTGGGVSHKRMSFPYNPAKP
jgi:hypothetical protein